MVEPMQRLVLPDPWQREALRGLRAGSDVVVDAPTGSGKTLIFELRLPELEGQAVYTVPTRALANDKFAEWRARGRDVGILTGDVVWNPRAPVVVATLEAALHRLLAGDAPALLVVDEFQMLADPARGGHYEIAVAAAPASTQLLMLSGSVANPGEVAAWLRRIGRNPAVVSHPERAVPLEEVLLDRLDAPVPAAIHGFWPRAIAAAIVSDLAPVLVFAPRRGEVERLAALLAAALPCPDPLRLTREQRERAGPALASCLERRVAFHHSGLAYPVRAGIVEPLARRGDCRVVVATMGLAAGINFSLRSVLVAGTRYFDGVSERELRPDELLQMFGRAGRRGIDTRGYVLSLSQGLSRMRDAAPSRLRRSPGLPWGPLLAAMARASERGERPFDAAARIAQRLFSAHPIPLGIERADPGTPRPCGLLVDAERARFRRRQVVQVRGPGGWSPLRERVSVPLRDALVMHGPGWIPALRAARTLAAIPFGRLCKLGNSGLFGREIAVLAGPELTRALRSDLRRNGHPEWIVPAAEQDDAWRSRMARWLEERACGGRFAGWSNRGDCTAALFDYSELPVDAVRDAEGAALVEPEERTVEQPACAGCPEAAACAEASAAMTPALAWRTLGLIEADGSPTRRGRVAALFQHGEGLAIAAALEAPDYPIRDLAFDLANLRAGHRFAGEEPVRGGRLGIRSAEVYRRADHPGYLEMGVPVHYGNGAARVVREIVEHRGSPHDFTAGDLHPGDIERALLEWRSLLRQVAQADGPDWDRWRELQRAARALLASAPAGSVPA
jgi:hypothetical protein